MPDDTLIAACDSELSTWLQSHLPDADISFAPPSDAATKRVAVSCYLYALASAPPMRTAASAGPICQQVALRYLVSITAPTPSAAHRYLGPVVFAAMDRDDWQVELEPLTTTFWQAFACVPRPAISLRVPLQLPRPVTPVGIVRHPIVIEQSPLRKLSGRVLGPQSIPIAGALLSLPRLNLRTRSDHRGRFTFPPIPSDPLPTELVISARGHVLQVAPQDHLGADHSLTITFPIPEN